MAEPIDAERFIALFFDRFPLIAAGTDVCARGVVHLEMHTFARATQAAIRAEDTATVKTHFAFIGEVFRLANPEVKNAVFVSYLECLSFDGRHGTKIKARQLLTPQLQAGLRELEAYNAELFKTARGRRG